MCVYIPEVHYNLLAPIQAKNLMREETETPVLQCYIQNSVEVDHGGVIDSETFGMKLPYFNQAH